MSSFDFSLESICLPYYEWAVKLATSVDKPKTMAYQTSFSEGTSASCVCVGGGGDKRSQSTTINMWVSDKLVTMESY